MLVLNQNGGIMLVCTEVFVRWSQRSLDHSVTAIDWFYKF